MSANKYFLDEFIFVHEFSFRLKSSFSCVEIAYIIYWCMYSYCGSAHTENLSGRFLISQNGHIYTPCKMSRTRSGLSYQDIAGLLKF